MSEKNFYEMLGVDKKADEQAIKKAYRKLIRQYHPDINKDLDAQTRAAEINTAYETLSDANKRAEYDAMLDNPFVGQDFGQTGQGFGGFGNFASGQGGFGAGSFSFEDIFSAFPGGGRQRKNSKGQDFYGPQKGSDEQAQLQVDLSVAYTGKDSKITLNLGHGRSKTLQVKIRKGMLDGQKIRLKNQGQPGTGGGENGDLYLTIRYSKSATHEVKNGKDVYQTLDVLPWDAALGAEQTITTPTGKIKVKLPANSRNGKTIRLKGRGIPALEAGDLYLVLNIILPKTTETDAPAWQALAEHFAGR